jgi:ribosomal protein S18 acetylase RimI-like enzyme
MRYVSSFLEVQQLIVFVRNQKKGFITNFYPEEFKINLWISNNELFYEDYTDSILFFHKCDGFVTLFYCTTTIDALDNALIKLESDSLYVVDILSNTSKSLVIEIFYNNGFKRHNSLVRMNKINQLKNIQYQPNENIKNADLSDTIEIQKIFFTYFDKFTEQIPINKELMQWIKQSHLIVYKDESKIVGFLIYDITGITLYLRYWFVRPEYRDQKVGSELIKEFLFRGKETKRQIFWVIESNENAIKRYLHYGFTRENMYDFVLIKNKKHEEKNNYNTPRTTS